MSKRAGVSLPFLLARLLADTAVRNLASKTPTEPQKERSRTDSDSGSADRSEVSGKVSKGSRNGSSHLNYLSSFLVPNTSLKAFCGRSTR